MTTFKGLHNFTYTYSENSNAVLQYGNFVHTLWFKVECEISWYSILESEMASKVAQEEEYQYQKSY